MNNPSAGRHAPSLGLWRRYRYWLTRLFAPGRHLTNQYLAFRQVLEQDGRALDLLTELESHLLGDNPADHSRICFLCGRIAEAVGCMIDQLQAMRPSAYRHLAERHASLASQIGMLTAPAATNPQPPYILPLAQAADQPELAGGKAANLARAGRAGVPIPQGFVITANAFHRFIQVNRLEDEFLQRFQLVHAGDHDTIIRITGELQELILGGEVPAEVADRIEHGLEALAPAQLLAVRSSALAEDGEVSFAGQYASELDVPPDEVLAAYKRVIAGKYCPRAVTYRIRHGLTDADTAMAVLVVPMITPRASGVVYSLDPANSPAGTPLLGIYAVAGLAEGLVDGSRTPEKYYLPRGNGAIPEPARPARDEGLLPAARLEQLRSWGLRLEAHFGRPQDIEWALDDTGLTVLQSRPLLQKKDPPPALVRADDLDRLLYSGLHCASAGTSCGPVFHARAGKAFRDIPVGSVVFTPTLRPALSQFLDRVIGVVAASGSRASHFASVARERAVPVVVGSEVTLAAGRIVTIDGSSGRIFDGCVNSVLQLGRLNPNTDFPRQKYAELSACTTHLSLTDPEDATFVPERCRSMHDLVRFCHEKSVREMFHLAGRKGRGLGEARKLVTDLPLVIYVLDLDKPRPTRAGNTITLEEIASLPMRACWQGMADPRIYWDSSQRHVDWEEFDQVSGGIFSLDTKSLASYAIVAREYLHLNIRFGYHFSIVDALCGGESATNYVNFRFKGGGAAERQKMFRLQFIDLVLTAFGFETSCQSDILDASFARAPQPATEQALQRLGMVLAETRLMDIRLTSEHQAEEEAARFILLADEHR